MSYAIMQTKLDPPPRSALEKAFRALPDLVAMDAANMARTAYGILIRGLDEAAAGTLCNALAAQGVASTMVDEQQLVKLPPGMQHRRIDCLPERLVIHDIMGRENPLDWQRVKLAAAGAVKLDRQKRVEKIRKERKWSGGLLSGGAFAPTMTVEVSDVSYRDVRQTSLLLELFIDAEPGRIQIDGNQFFYHYLGTRLSDRREMNFERMLEDIHGLARKAIFNRGIENLIAEGPPLPEYPSRAAFEEEITWLLWRRKQDPHV